MLTEICVDAVLAVKSSDEKTPLDLHMVELMDMQHRAEQVRATRLEALFRRRRFALRALENFLILHCVTSTLLGTQTAACNAKGLGLNSTRALSVTDF